MEHEKYLKYIVVIYGNIHGTICKYIGTYRDCIYGKSPTTRMRTTTAASLAKEFLARCDHTATVGGRSFENTVYHISDY